MEEKDGGLGRVLRGTNRSNEVVGIFEYLKKSTVNKCVVGLGRIVIVKGKLSK